jgi:hypothetical protein
VSGPWLRFLDLRIEEDEQRRLRITMDRHRPLAVVERKSMALTEAAIEGSDAMSALVVACAAAQAAAGAARSEAAKLASELVTWQDRDAEWKEATGLMCGGDPGGVEPRHLQEHIQALNRLEQAARAWRTAGGPPHPERVYTDPSDVVEKVMALEEAVDALPPEGE